MVGCTCLWYRLITICLVQVGAWLMHFFMVQVDYRLMYGLDLLVQVYNGISHSDSVTLVLSFYFYFSVPGRGKDKWL
jgi:hypothetical protein